MQQNKILIQDITVKAEKVLLGIQLSMPEMFNYLGYSSSYELFLSSYDTSSQAYGKIYACLEKEGNDYFQKHKESIKILLGKYSDYFFETLDFLNLHSFGISYYRRSFRSKNNKYYIRKQLNILKAFFELNIYDTDLRKLLSDGYILVRNNHESVITDNNFSTGVIYSLVCELNKNNKEYIELVREAVYENSTVKLSYNIIKALLYTTNKDCYKIVEDLLLAAKLQEGLRQAVFESMDEGTEEAFMHIYKIITDNDMQRFSATVRAFTTWTGLDLTVEKPKLIKDLFASYYKVMLSPETFLKSSDHNMEFYMSLWATGFREIDEVMSFIEKNFDKLKKHQQYMLLAFMENVEIRNKMYYFYLLMKYDDLSICAYAIRNVSSILKELSKDEKMEFFNKIYEFTVKIGKEHTVEQPSPLVSYTITKESCYRDLINIAAELDEKEYFDLLRSEDKKITGYIRYIYVSSLFKSKSVTDKVDFLVNYVSDRSSEASKFALKELAALDEINDSQYQLIENALKSKSGNTRRSIIQLILKRDNTGLQESLERLISAKDNNKLSAALDLIHQIKPEKERKAVFKTFAAKVKELSDLSSDNMVIVSQILDENKSESIIDESQVYKIDDNSFYVPAILPYCSPVTSGISGLISKITGSKPKDGKILLKPFERDFNGNLFNDYIYTGNNKHLQSIVNEMVEIIERNKNYTYQAKLHNGTVQDVLFSPQYYYTQRLDASKKDSFDNIPLGNEFKTVLEKATQQEIIQLYFAYISTTIGRRYYRVSNNEINEHFRWQDLFLQKLFGWPSNEFVFNYGYLRIVIDCALELLDKENLFELYFSLMLYAYNALPLDKVQKELEIKNKNETKYYESPVIYHNFIEHLMERAYTSISSNEDRKRYHDFVNYMHTKLGKDFKPCRNYYYFDNVQTLFINKIIDVNEVYRIIINYSSGALESYTRYRSNQNQEMIKAEKTHAEDAGTTENILEETELDETEELEDTDELDGAIDDDSEIQDDVKVKQNYDPEFMAILDKLLYFVVDQELNRGESDTIYSHVAKNVYFFEGTAYFARIAVALGKSKLVRGRYFSWGKPSKTEMLSHLLNVCKPLKGESEKDLAKYLKGVNINEDTLIDMALYAPTFIDMVGKFLKIKGFNIVCWYFICHVNGSHDFFVQKNMPKYTSLEPSDLVAGAFDSDLFEKAYKTGKKIFDQIYESAKYTAEGSAHRRAQIFADVRLGRLKEKELLEKINTTRNKDYLLAYGALPVKTTKDILKIYERIQLFLKESRKFGAQRQASEKRVVEMSMLNLSKNAGYSDVNQFVWFMESAKIKENMHFFKPNKIKDIEVWIDVSEEGIPSLMIQKGKKLQKTLPKTITKDDYILDIKGYLKSLKEQEKRAKGLFEKSMINEDWFELENLENIKAHVIINKIITKLVFSNEKHMGFLTGKYELTDFDGTIVKLKKTDKLKISHPVDMYESKKWSGYQKYVVENQLVQPFKQVFRELYLPTHDELTEGNKARRYAGHQIQPARANALFKTRGWSVGYYGEVEKINYRYDTVTNVYIQGDLFSPSDVEYPTIEYVNFYNRLTGTTVAISELNKVLFSETMRDIDLVVSVAHAGDVNPEASQSTVEMRAALIRELLPLLKLDNVQVEKTFTKIRGTMGEYSVHMGSGQMFRNGLAMGVFAIQSQHRGRIFLPFADDDPRTAEIITKVMMFAKDNEIKDPTIISQLRG